MNLVGELGGTYSNVEYIGDSVYIGIDKFGRLWIFIFNGIQINSEICLEDDVLGNLMQVVNSVTRMRRPEDVNHRQ